FMLIVMFGALFQILPVVAGVAVAGGAWLAAVVHVALALGAAMLSWGLGGGGPELVRGGALLLGAAATTFVAAVAVGLWGARADLDTQRDLRLALIGIGVAAMLGATLAMVLTGDLALPFAVLLELHVGWALMGAAGMLLVATSWIVVPMFQITPAYPVWMTRGWVIVCFVALVAWSAALVAGLGALAGLALGLVLALVACFAGTILWLQRRSRRAMPDATTRAFRVAMVSFAAGIGCVVAARALGGDAWAVAAGVLLLYGGFAGAIQGMLYKIVPFLCWLDLSQSGRRAPNVRKLQPDARVALHARLHKTAVAFVLVAVFVDVPWLTRTAGLLVATEFALLLWIMVGVMRAHRAVASSEELVRKN
ncbi:MAG: hypothetical protein H2060_07240, partial [Azoarcus sp.]|nr:hypothetical protein [Azoarcus sp.]